jgi:hypothetical protein
MASSRTVYHVVPNASAEAWVVSQENNDREQEPSQVKVHKSGGNMEYESTYGEDPGWYPS